MNTVARLMLVCFVALVAAAPSRAQPLPTDPSLMTGELDNGLRYIVKRHDIPAGRAMIWLHMHTGSLNETDRQRGIAHYLEHMAFNGSEHFAPGTLVPLFQSLGMSFGRDQNAFTNNEQTTFQLTLPKTDPETIGKGMTFFADVLSRLSLLPAEIDAERQIIQEERRRGLSARQRTSDYVRERMTPGSIYAMRDTIGTEETINGVKQADFRDYYGTWYAASNATLIVVADAEEERIIKAIQDAFGTAPKQPRPTPQAAGVKAYDRSFAIVATDPEVRSEDVRITRVEPARPPVTTVPQYRDDLVLRLGEMALNDRLGDKAAAGGTAYTSARVSSGTQSDAIYTAGISARANPGKWKSALEEAALELQRARTFGFTTREIEDAKKEITSGAERAVETEGTAQAQAIIGRLNGDVATGEPTMSAPQRLTLLKQILPSITNEEVAKRFASEFDPKAVAFIATLPTEGAPTEAQLLDIGTKALAVKPTQESETVHATALMTEKPAPGTVKEGSEHEASRVWSGWLSNGVRVHYRFMDEQQNAATVRITLLGGELLETAENRGVTEAAQLAWQRPATRKLTSADIRELMTGKKVSVRGGGFGGFGGGGRGRGGGGGGGSTDGISLSIQGSPEEFETGFQLAYLLLTEPKIEPASFAQFQSSLKQRLEESLKNPGATGARIAASLLYPTTAAQTQPLTAEQIDRLTVESAQSWLEKLIKESPIEVAIVGDIPQDRALDLAARYLGGLPTRDRISTDAFKTQRSLKRPAGARTAEQVIDTPTKQAYVFSGFYGADESNRADVTALSMAARLISTRMVKEVREDAQLVYSISAGSRAAATYPGFGVFSAAAPTDPPKTAALVAKLASMYKAFAKDGPTEDEMTVAKKQMAVTFDEQVRQPGYWSGRLDRLTFRGTNLDDVLGEPAAFQALTREQVRQAFAKYYSKDNSIVVVVKPRGEAAAGADGDH